ncbi:MAG TPA: 50S ribosomal protein L3 [Elusimicrobia bacterium]|nr:50S ribosomal protein L3 [Elusimicrobiota bacterium]HCE97302.1 50S ribosomal protein L3 [Elusimicrobiota bacterium]
MTEENKNAGEQPQTAPETKAQPAEMPLGLKFLIGRKLGMTQVFDAAGELFAVSVVQAGPCRVMYTRTPEKDGYKAVCLGFGHMTEKNVNAARMGIFKKLDMKPVRKFKEFRVSDLSGVMEGQVANLAARFAEGEYLDLQSVSKGHGFAGGMKRYNFRGGPASHGASDRERAPGSIGSRRSLGRVLPGQRMAGHMGVETVSMQKIKIIKIIPEENMLLVNGSVPGAAGSLVYITKTNKKTPKPMVAKGKTKGKQAPVKAAAPKKAAAPAKK